MKKFVYIKNDFKSNDILVLKNEIGIVESEKQKHLIINFVYSNCTIKLPNTAVEFFNPLKTGDLYDKKVCNVCHRLLNTNQFQKNQNGKNNRTVRRPSCNECRNLIDGKGMNSSQKRNMEKSKPNYEIWTCPICKKRTIPGLTSKVVCDHNHKTGNPRSWICDSCNTGLGRFKDNILLLQNAIAYLNEHNNECQCNDN